MRSCSPSRHTSKTPPRRNVSRALAAFFGVMLATAIGLPTDPLWSQEQVHLRTEQALARAFPKLSRLESAVIRISPERRQTIREERGISVSDAPQRIYRGFAVDGSPLGTALFVDEIGKFRPITFIVSLDPQQKVRDVAVCVYRESHGAEITRSRFLRQFRKKGIDDSLRLHREVINISGATLSGRASIRAVRRALVLVHEQARRDGGLDRLVWREEQPLDLGAVPTERVERRPAMGTLLEVSIEANWEEAGRGIDAVFAVVDRLTQQLDGRRDRSDIARILAASPGEPVSVHPDTLTCLARALEVAEASGGAFDPSRVAGGWKEIHLDTQAGTVTRGPRIERIDLGAIGKGFALDRAAEELDRLGLSRALLNFGGQILALDPPLGCKGWPVAVVDPRAVDCALEIEELTRASVACSGESYRGSHIIDPETGEPAEVPLLTAVFAEDATTADAWSTALAVLGVGETERATRDRAVKRISIAEAR